MWFIKEKAAPTALLNRNSKTLKKQPGQLSGCSDCSQNGVRTQVLTPFFYVQIVLHDF
jgi:hypothetical protein